MSRASHGALGSIALVGLVLASHAAEVEDPAAAQDRLQELLSREALFYHHQGDHLAAITRLQQAHARGLTADRVAAAQLLEVRLKLAYGLHERVEGELSRLLDAGVPQRERNQAWFELAQALFKKGYAEAAGAALEQVQAPATRAFAGEVQLLRGHVLLARKDYPAAAQALEPWQGPRALAGYARFNRGIALLGAGEQAQAIAVLKRVARERPADEEGRALRDRANLTLGYVLLQAGDATQAHQYFGQVREQGPYASRALHAIGLIEQEKGRPTAALEVWNRLRQGAPADATVQESYLAVPGLLREQRAPEAPRLYEEAVAALSRELDEVTRAQAVVRAGNNLEKLLREGRVPAAALSEDEGGADPAGESRYLGRLMASRSFLETSLGHGDLLAMLAEVDRGLRDMNRLSGVVPASEGAVAAGAAGIAPRGAAEAVPGGAPPQADVQPEKRAESRTRPDGELAWRGAPRSGRALRGIPLLPEIDLPPGSERALPGADLSGLPGAPEVIGLPSAAEWLAPEEATGQDLLPSAPEIVWLPPASGFLDQPGRDDEFAYPDLARDGERRDAARAAGRRTLPGEAPAAGRRPAIGSAETLGGLSAGMGQTNERIARLLQTLSERGYPGKDLRERIRALQERARRLRERIAGAIELHERYAQALILDELQQRQSRLEDYLRQARLELAKSYDQDTGMRR